MKNLYCPFLILFFSLWTTSIINGQCADLANIYSFSYNGHSYELIKENKTWHQSVACAIERGGYLAEINDIKEQDSVFNKLINNANIAYANTLNIFGTSSIWIGGTDSIAEGVWIWDGNNDGAGMQFWNGGPTGNPVNGAYTKWGTSPAEPDNSGGQDYLSLIIDNRKVNYGRWNDLNATDNLFYLIEHNPILNSIDLGLKMEMYPNPIYDKIVIKNLNTIKINWVEIRNSIGLRVMSNFNIENAEEIINVSHLNTGIYLVIFQFESGERVIKKFVKQ